MNEEVVVDESLESRSMLVYGVESMKQMKRANVLVSGLGGAGIEIGQSTLFNPLIALSLKRPFCVLFMMFGLFSLIWRHDSILTSFVMQ